MKKMLMVVGLVAAVSVVCGWDQVKRSIYELTAHTVIADVATVGALTVTTIGGTAQATILAGSAAGATALQPNGNLLGSMGTSTTAVATVVSGAASGATALQGATFAQVDTNVTTTITGYTPAFRGQVLVGGAGEGTNGVWVAKGVTTNDWVQVH
jgi:hypothetical protein